MTDNDRELLGRAARAARYVFDTFCDGKPIRRESDGQPVYWNPLADDGDALRLAVELKIEIVEFRDTVVPSRGVAWNHKCNALWEPEGNDPCAATRRAVVRAAAAIGESMK